MNAYMSAHRVHDLYYILTDLYILTCNEIFENVILVLEDYCNCRDFGSQHAARRMVLAVCLGSKLGHFYVAAGNQVDNVAYAYIVVAAAVSPNS